jgi:hypothetical protein
LKRYFSTPVDGYGVKRATKDLDFDLGGSLLKWEKFKEFFRPVSNSVGYSPMMEGTK